jgi:hypothetical protein
VSKSAPKVLKAVGALSASLVLAASLLGQVPDAPRPAEQPNAAQASPRLQFDMPKSYNPLHAYAPDTVPEPALANSSRLDRLTRDGKLYLSLRDAIDLALEDNLDLAIARYNLPIANTDILRTQAGGFFRGVNTGVVQGTPGGGIGGFGTGAPGAGAGGTTSGAGGAGAGASGLVQSTLGTGTLVSSYDPLFSLTGGSEHLTSPEANRQIYGVSSLQANTVQVAANFSQRAANHQQSRFQFVTHSKFEFPLPDSTGTTGRFRSLAEPALPLHREE